MRLVQWLKKRREKKLFIGDDSCQPKNEGPEDTGYIEGEYEKEGGKTRSQNSGYQRSLLMCRKKGKKKKKKKENEIVICIAFVVVQRRMCCCALKYIDSQR
jgi:hypothetical protein